MIVNDAHVHFFSAPFFDRLAQQRHGPAEEGTVPCSGAQIVEKLGWEAPGGAAALADRWAGELDRHGVSRAMLIASVPGDEASVGAAVARRPDRFVGAFMLDPTSAGFEERVDRAMESGHLRVVCLFAAMHHVGLDDARTLRVFEAAARHAGAVFAHCGALSVGVRKRLGLPSPFEARLGNPLDLQPAAQSFPDVPILVPHVGAGFLREALMLADLCPNVYLDTSSSNAWIRYHPGLTLAGALRQAIEVLGPDRLLFGTDSSYFPRGWHRAIFDAQRAALAEAGVGEEAQARVFGGSFDRLFQPRPARA
jgi:predicted TIM-barrel fold metal-dependent hydrolase